MSGCKTGVQQKFKDHVPGLVYTHCVAHRAELAILDSIKSTDNYIEKFDETLNNIFKFYYYSTKRRKELKDIAELFQGKFRQLGLVRNIRWIASRSRALNVIEKDYRYLVYDLEQKSYGSDETAKKSFRLSYVY
jgi:hypothetical protein